MLTALHRITYSLYEPTLEIGEDFAEDLLSAEDSERLIRLGYAKKKAEPRLAKPKAEPKLKQASADAGES